MLIFTNLMYGVVKVSTSLLIGANLWFQRTPGNRVEPQDLLEIRQGLVERCLVTQYDPIPTNAPFDTTDVYQLAPNGNEIVNYYLPSTDTNKIPKPYIIPKAVKVGVLTNMLYTYNYYRNSPPDYPKAFPTYNYTNKFLTGIFSNLTVSGFTDNATVFNGDYQLKSDYVFVMGNEVIQYGADYTIFYDFDMYLEKEFVPWVNGLPVIIPDYQSSTLLEYTNYPTINVYNLNTNDLTDAPFVEKTPAIGWPMVNQMADWAHELGATDDNLFNGWRGFGYPPTPMWNERAMLYPTMSIDSTGTNTLSEQPFFFNGEKFGSDYVNEFDLAIPVSSLETFLGTTNVYWFSNTWYQFIAFNDNSITYYSANNDDWPYWANQNEYSIKKQMLTDRYRALSILRSTMNYPIVWKHDTTNNVMYAHGHGTSLGAALSDAAANKGYLTQDGAPYGYMDGAFDGVNYYIDAGSRSTKMIVNINSNISYTSAWFIKGKLYPNVAYHVTNNTFYTYGPAVVTNLYTYVDGAVGGYTNQAISSVISGGDPFSSPVTIGPVTNWYYVKGWATADQDIQLFWDMKYCTGTIP